VNTEKNRSQSLYPFPADNRQKHHGSETRQTVQIAGRSISPGQHFIVISTHQINNKISQSHKHSPHLPHSSCFSSFFPDALEIFFFLFRARAGSCGERTGGLCEVRRLMMVG
jgi:hypothetical protein